MSNNPGYEKAVNAVKDVLVDMAVKQAEMNEKITEIDHAIWHDLKHSGIPLDKVLFEIAKRVVDDPRYPAKGVSLQTWVDMLKIVLGMQAKGVGT